VNRLPIRLQLTLAFAAAMALLLAALGFLLYTRMESALDGAVERNLRSRGEDVAALVQHGGIGLPQGGLTEEGQTFAQVLDPGGNIVDSSAELDRALLTSADLARTQRGAFFVDRPIPRSDELGRLFVLPLDVEGVRRIVVVGESLEAKGDALENLLTLLWIGGPLLLVLASAGAYALAGRALRPVNQLLGRVEAALARERRFVADASHELRTPLAALRTELELALRRERSREELEAALRSASEEAERLSRLAEDLLVLARAQEGQLPVRRERVPVAHVLEGVTSRYGSRAEAVGRAFSVETTESRDVSVDRLRIEQALGNLIENAFRHGQGTIALAVEWRNGHVEFHVRDEGRGFDADFLSHAFEPFARADPARSSHGAGLGLAIVDVIARAHGGRARAANTERGADVWLELPEEPGRLPAR
jgi:two-component system OmpR family sensor kinase